MLKGASEVFNEDNCEKTRDVLLGLFLCLQAPQHVPQCRSDELGVLQSGHSLEFLNDSQVGFGESDRGDLQLIVYAKLFILDRSQPCILEEKYCTCMSLTPIVLACGKPRVGL